MARKQREAIPPPAVMIFHEYFDVVAEWLTNEQLGLLWRAVMLHHEGKEITELKLDNNTLFAFNVLRQSIDAATKKYYDGKANSAYGGFKNACYRADIAPPSQEEWEDLGRPSFREWRNIQKDNQSRADLKWI